MAEPRSWPRFQGGPDAALAGLAPCAVGGQAAETQRGAWFALKSCPRNVGTGFRICTSLLQRTPSSKRGRVHPGRVVPIFPERQAQATVGGSDLDGVSKKNKLVRHRAEFLESRRLATSKVSGASCPVGAQSDASPRLRLSSEIAGPVDVGGLVYFLSATKAEASPVLRPAYPADCLSAATPSQLRRPQKSGNAAIGNSGADAARRVPCLPGQRILTLTGRPQVPK